MEKKRSPGLRDPEAEMKHYYWMNNYAIFNAALRLIKIRKFVYTLLQCTKNPTAHMTSFCNFYYTFCAPITSQTCYLFLDTTPQILHVAASIACQVGYIGGGLAGGCGCGGRCRPGWQDDGCALRWRRSVESLWNGLRSGVKIGFLYYTSADISRLKCGSC